MKTTFFAPLAPLPDAALSDEAYSNRHCTQTTPTEIHDLDLAGLFDFIVGKAKVGRKGDAGYIIAGACETTRKEGGPAPFVLIDYDDRPDGPDWALLDEYRGFAWTTASGHPHWRVLIPLLVPMAHGKLECPFPGGHIRNRTQPAFLPTHPTDAALIQWRVLEGAKSLDGEALGKPAGTFEALEGSMLGALFSAAGLVEGEQAGALIVRCPWQHEHTGGRGGGTVVFHDDEEHTGLGKFHCGHGHCNGRGTAEAIEALRPLPAVAAELEHWPTPPLLGNYVRVDTPAPKPAPKEPSPFLDWDEMLEISSQPVDWLCRDLQLCPGRPAALVAAPNVGKSWALSAMALAVAGEGPVFGAFECRHGPVLHVATDAGAYATSDKYRKLSRGARPTHPIRVWPGRVRCVDAKRGQFDPTQPGWKAIVAEVERAATAGAPYALVIFDSLFAVAAGVEMNAPEAAEPLWATRSWGSTAVLWAMHTTKGKGANATRAAYGSVAIEAACGAMWYMGLVDDDKKKPRAWELLRRAEEAGGAGLDSFHTDWPGEARIAVVPTPESQEGATPVQQMQYEMLTYLERHGHASYAQLMTAAGCPPGTTGRAKRRAVAVVAALAQSGQITCSHGQNYILPPGAEVPRAARACPELVRLSD